MTYWRLHYHLIWGTHELEPSITPEREKMFYGALTVGEHSLATVMEYTSKQKEHHRENDLIAAYERIEED